MDHSCCLHFAVDKHYNMSTVTGPVTAIRDPNQEPVSGVPEVWDDQVCALCFDLFDEIDSRDKIAFCIFAISAS